MTKPTKRFVRPAKTQISLDIHPVWSKSSLSAWRNYLLSAKWRLWSDWADAQDDLSLCCAHRSFCWFCLAAAQLVNHWVHEKWHTEQSPYSVISLTNVVLKHVQITFHRRYLIFRFKVEFYFTEWTPKVAFSRVKDSHEFFTSVVRLHDMCDKFIKKNICNAFIFTAAYVPKHNNELWKEKCWGDIRLYLKRLGIGLTRRWVSRLNRSLFCP